MAKHDSAVTQSPYCELPHMLSFFGTVITCAGADAFARWIPALPDLSAAMILGNGVGFAPRINFAGASCFLPSSLLPWSCGMANASNGRISTPRNNARFHIVLLLGTV